MKALKAMKTIKMLQEENKKFQSPKVELPKEIHSPLVDSTEELIAERALLEEQIRKL